jgi:intracellular septation protein
MKLLLEAGPLAAFLIVYGLAGIYLATAALIVLSLMALVAGRWIEGRFSGLTLFTVSISVVLGSLTLLLHNPSFIQIKPTVVFTAFTLALGGSHFVGDTVALQRLFGNVWPLPTPLWRKINAAWALYFAVHAVLNLYVAMNFSEQTWVYFKVFGFGAITVLFALAHAPFVWRYRERPLLITPDRRSREH